MIYFIRRPDNGLIKIGTTSRLSRRHRELLGDYEESLVVLAITDGGVDRERDLHEHFAHLRIAGEWFEAGDDLMSFIATECREWDGTDDIVRYRKGNMVRMDKAVVERAKRAAAIKGISLNRYITESMMPIVDHILLEEANRTKTETIFQESP